MENTKGVRLPLTHTLKAPFSVTLGIPRVRLPEIQDYSCQVWNDSLMLKSKFLTTLCIFDILAVLEKMYSFSDN